MFTKKKKMLVLVIFSNSPDVHFNITTCPGCFSIERPFQNTCSIPRLSRVMNVRLQPYDSPSPPEDQSPRCEKIHTSGIHGLSTGSQS